MAHGAWRTARRAGRIARDAWHVAEHAWRVAVTGCQLKRWAWSAPVYWPGGARRASQLTRWRAEASPRGRQPRSPPWRRALSSSWRVKRTGGCVGSYCCSPACRDGGDAHDPIHARITVRKSSGLLPLSLQLAGHAKGRESSRAQRRTAHPARHRWQAALSKQLGEEGLHF
jgi:hypothetical protein